MQSMWRLAQVSVLVVLAASRIGAQEDRRVALDLGFPPALAILWHVNDKLDLRPDLAFAHSSGDVSGDQTRLAIGASALFPMTSSGQLTPYVGLRGGYSWYSGDNAPKDWSLAGIFGARFAIDKRVGVSAETGLIYDHLHLAAGPFSSTDNTVDTWGRVSALVYF
ncbi:MAG TPA: hypothetical protein VJO33_12605 [Gemmatimonadaceae bacterium]|nr:hypothetical protein [Gemmatimonadaceae bacterium]